MNTRRRLLKDFKTIFISQKKKKFGEESKEKFINDLKTGWWKIEILDTSVARKI